MKLDRNTSSFGRGKYGLIKNRRLQQIVGPISPPPTDPVDVGEVRRAINVLTAAGVIDWGDTPETEFFAIRLKDINARPALFAYASGAAMHGDKEYAEDVFALAHRAGKKHPNCKMPD